MKLFAMVVVAATAVVTFFGFATFSLAAESAAQSTETVKFVLAETGTTVFGLAKQVLGDGTLWKSDALKLTVCKTGKPVSKANDRVFPWNTCVEITKSKPTPVTVAKAVLPAAPADKIVVFKSGDVPHALALAELGDAAAWKLNGVRYLHPTRDEEFAKTDEATRRYPVGTRMVIAHELAASRSKGSVGVESKTPAGDRKIVATAPVMPPMQAVNEAVQKTEPPITPKAAAVLPAPAPKKELVKTEPPPVTFEDVLADLSGERIEPTKPAAESLPPSVPKDPRVAYDDAAWLNYFLSLAIWFLWTMVLVTAAMGLWVFGISPRIVEHRTRRWQKMSHASPTENVLDENLSILDRQRGMAVYEMVAKEFSGALLREIKTRGRLTIMDGSGGYIPPSDFNPTKFWIDVRVAASSSQVVLQMAMQDECDQILAGQGVPRADWFGRSEVYAPVNGHDGKSFPLLIAFHRKAGFVRILSSATPTAVPAADKSRVPA